MHNRSEETIRQEIEALLRARIGLNPDSIGSRSILRAVNKGMRTGKLKQLSEYLTNLESNPQQFEALVESVVVPETSFFRNRASFVYLRQWIRNEWKRERPLRVLSLPCSTGEEPFSIAITLLEESLTLDDFQIDAVDISTLALSKAKQGIFSPYAFRRQTYRKDDRYFTLGAPPKVTRNNHITQRYYLVDWVRDKVNFQQGNILDPRLLENSLPYDIVFCRNLLIYFDRDARYRTFEKLNQLLREGGLLFLGYAESGMVDTQSFQPVPYPQTFAYRKLPPAPSPLDNQVLIEAGLTFSDEKIVYQKDGETASAVDTSDSLAGISDDLLKHAQGLADNGEIEASIEACDRYLTHHPINAEAHVLRGELHQTRGDLKAAETSYKKALYLNPHNVEALTHLMFLKEEQHDTEAVARLRARLQKLSDSGVDE